MRPLISLSIAALATLLFLAGCASAPPRMQYYQLEATTPVSPVEALPELAIGVGPITLPGLLKRQEVVTRKADSHYQLSDKHRWGGMLEDLLAAAINVNLGKQLGTEQVYSYPWRSYFKPAYRILIDITDFTGVLGGKAALRAGWIILDAQEQQVSAKKISEYERETGGGDYNHLIQTENRLISDLCEEISEKLRELAKGE